MAEGTRTHGESRTRDMRTRNLRSRLTPRPPCAWLSPVTVLPQRAETTVCVTFTIAHVNATHPSSELDVVSVLSKNLSPV